MPYKRNADLPTSVRNALPTAAQTVWRKAFNASERQYGEERAFRIAWAAVKRSYEQRGGRWVRKDVLEEILSKAVQESFRQNVTIDEEDLGGLKGPRAKAAARFWKENWWRMVSRPGRGRYVLQHHWRGLLDTEVKKPEQWLIENTRHSVHEDLRHQAARDWSGEPSAANLFGLAVFVNVTELRQADGPILPVLGTSRAPQLAFQIGWKLPQPEGWLDVGRERPLVAGPKDPGSTTRRYAKFFAVDWGEYRVGVCREHSFEIFYKSARRGGMRGRYVVSLARIRGEPRWLIRKPEDQTPIAEREDPERFMQELREKGQRFLVWSDGESQPIVYDVRTGEKVVEKVFRVKIVKRMMEEGLVYGEVLVPGETDAQKDMAPLEEVRQAAHNFLVKSRRLDYRHRRLLGDDEAVVVESWLSPTTFEWEGRTIKEGTWLMGVRVFPEWLKKEIETGELNSFSIRGLARKE